MTILEQLLDKIKTTPGAKSCLIGNFGIENLDHFEVVHDMRSYKDSAGYWHVYPIAVFPNDNNTIWYIVCPLCGRIHHHSGGKGHRVDHHCYDPYRRGVKKEEKDNGYILESPEEWEAQMDEKGNYTGDRHYNFSHIKAFKFEIEQ